MAFMQTDSNLGGTVSGNFCDPEKRSRRTLSMDLGDSAIGSEKLPSFRLQAADLCEDHIAGDGIEFRAY